MASARVISKGSEDHDIGRRLDRGVRLQEFITKRLYLGLDCLLVLKKGAPGYATAITALYLRYAAHIGGMRT